MSRSIDDLSLFEVIRVFFSHALVLGFVTPIQAPGQCFSSLVFSLLFSLLVLSP